MKISLTQNKLTTGKAHTSSKAKAPFTHLYLLLTAASNKEGFNLTKALGSVSASILSHPPFSILPKGSPQYSKEENGSKHSDCLNMLFVFFSHPEVAAQGGTGCIPPCQGEM